MLLLFYVNTFIIFLWILKILIFIIYFIFDILKGNPYFILYFVSIKIEKKSIFLQETLNWYNQNIELSSTTQGSTVDFSTWGDPYRQNCHFQKKRKKKRVIHDDSNKITSTNFTRGKERQAKVWNKPRKACINTSWQCWVTNQPKKNHPQLIAFQSL